MECEVFKIVNDLSTSFISDLIAANKMLSVFNEILNSAFIPKTRTTKYGLKSFAHGGALVCNSLPDELRIIYQKTMVSFAD